MPFPDDDRLACLSFCINAAPDTIGEKHLPFYVISKSGISNHIGNGFKMITICMASLCGLSNVKIRTQIIIIQFV